MAEMLGISATALALILLGTVVAMSMILYYDMGQRIRGDFMFGIDTDILRSQHAKFGSITEMIIT